MSIERAAGQSAWAVERNHEDTKNTKGTAYLRFPFFLFFVFFVSSWFNLFTQVPKEFVEAGVDCPLGGGLDQLL